MPGANKMSCADCGVEMNHHANKIEYAEGREDYEGAGDELGGTLVEAHTCPRCGQTATRDAEAGV